nr:RagB/SusD family nutrient uptake outer membrane protein [uncultured Pedobacter sp.]
MKKTTIISIIALGFFAAACNKNFLDVPVKNKVTPEALYGDENGIKAFLASIYQDLPIEDFRFSTRNGFNQADPGGEFPIIATPDAVVSRGYSIMYNKGGANFTYWTGAFSLIRDINTLDESIPLIKPGVMPENEKQSLKGEVAFLRAYTYFALAKRFGGVPIITKRQDYDPDVTKLMVPRATEKETYDFILDQCDTAAKYLIPTEERRATKWAALALKSRAALYAASIAKYPVTGSSQAASAKLIDALPSYPGLANEYYKKCIDASLQIIDPNSDVGPSGFGLYQPHPASPAEALKNYQKLFESAENSKIENIFVKGYTIPGSSTGHSWDLDQCTPQITNGYTNGGTGNPTLDLIDLYETYSSNGASVPINTKLNNSLGYAVFAKGTQAQYRHFSNPQDIFAGKDARMFATVITPSSIWKNTKIIIQAGMVKPDGNSLYRQDGNVVFNGNSYYAYGASTANSYSGWGNDSQHSFTGFLIRKYVTEDATPLPTAGSITTDFIDMRYAEVLLNFAEAVTESGYTDNNAVALAAKAVNIIRQRAGFTYMLPTPVTIPQILRERRVEFAMEGSITLWDLIRRREYDDYYTSFKHKVLCPMLDLTTPTPSYFFVRDLHSKQSGVMIWNGTLKDYYFAIPGTGTNGLIPNN